MAMQFELCNTGCVLIESVSIARLLEVIWTAILLSIKSSISRHHLPAITNHVQSKLVCMRRNYFDLVLSNMLFISRFTIVIVCSFRSVYERMIRRVIDRGIWKQRWSNVICLGIFLPANKLQYFRWTIELLILVWSHLLFLFFNVDICSLFTC